LITFKGIDDVRKPILLSILLMFFITGAYAADSGSDTVQSATAETSMAGVNRFEPLNSGLSLGGRWFRGPVYASAAYGDHVYFGSGGAIRVLKVTKDRKGKKVGWEEIGSIEIAGVVRDLEATRKYLFVADDGGALRILDISRPKSPRPLGELELPNFVRAVSIAGDYAYLATGWNGLVVVDISNPETPRLVGKLKSNDKLGYVVDVHVDGTIAVMADYHSGIRIVDVSDPASPFVAGTVKVDGQAHGVFKQGSRAYVVALEDPAIPGSGGLTIAAISDPANPVIESFERLEYGAERVWVEDDFAYLAGVANDAGLIIVDVKTPGAPRRLGSFTHPTCSESVMISEGFAYLAHGDVGLEIIDLSDPRSPFVQKHYSAAGHVRGVQVIDETAYVANGYAGFRILDTSDPQAPRELAWAGTHRALDVAVAGDHAYVADDWAGLKVFNVNDPAAPWLEARLDTPGYAESVAVHRSRLYIADGDGGLRVINILNPRMPAVVSQADSEGYAFDVATRERVAFLADGKGGLRIFLDSRSEALEIGRFKPDRQRFEARAVEVNGKYAFVAAGGAGLSVLDISDLRNPVEIAHLKLPSEARSVAVDGNLMYVGDRRGVTAFDISNPSVPEQLHREEVPANADRIAISGSRVYVAAREAGFLIFE
jgi:hypothetical protein